MGTYYQLIQRQRYQIAVLLETGHQQKDIASVVGRASEPVQSSSDHRVRDHAPRTGPGDDS